MLKRQDSLLSSSYLRTPPPPPSKTTENRHAKLTGCFPAIFKLISSKYNNRKKLLTFGKKLKTPRNVVSTPTTETESFRLSTADNSADSVLKEEDIKNDIKEEDRDLESRKLTGDVTPRSPMLPPEIRLMAGNAVPAVPERPALVARLMGLEDDHQPGSKTIKKDDEEEKRRRLLEALEKCNEDLVSLKKVIMAVQLVEDKHNKKSAPSEIFQLPRPTTPDSDDSDGDDVVDYVGGRSPPPFRRYNYAANLHHNGVMPQQRKKLLGKKPGEEEEGVGISFIDKVQAESLKMKRKAANPNAWSSKAMIQSVEEVCNDIVWGEKRERQNLELVLDNYISRDLIEEVVFDLGFHRPKVRLPFEACRRRISF